MITDTNNQPLSSVSVSLTESTDSAVVVVRVPCKLNQTLSAETNTFAQVWARRTGSGEPFSNIAASPISVAPYANQTIDFDVFVRALSVTNPVERVALPVHVR